MRRWKVTYCFLFLTLLSLSGRAQQMLQINDAGQIEVENLRPYITVYETDQKLTPQEAYTKLRYSPESQIPKKLSFGYSNNYFWIYLKAINLTPTQYIPYLVINNPQIDSVQLWNKTVNGQIIKMGIAGDALAFDLRPIPTPKIAFEIPLKPYAPQEYVICVNKRYSSVSIPISLTSKTQFWQKERDELLFYGMYFGCSLAIICYVFILYLRTREHVFMWYIMYLMFIGMYLVSEIGITAQFLTTHIPQVNNYTKPVSITIASVALIKFIEQFLRLPKHFPKLLVWYNVVGTLLVIITLYWVITPQWIHIQSVYFLTAQNLIILFSLVLVVFSSILTFSKEKVISSFFISAFMAVLLAGLAIIFIEFGWIPKDYFETNPLFIGSLIEVFMLAAGLSVWYKNLQKEHAVLSRKLVSLTDDVYSSYISGVESKKQKFAFELHDNIGSRLSNLSRMIARVSEANDFIIQRIRTLTQTARSLSHRLSPTPFTSISFEDNLQQLAHSFKEPLDINLQAYIDQEQPYTHVQEEIIKITRDTLTVLEDLNIPLEVHIQFFVHTNEIVLQIETEDYIRSSSTVNIYLKELIEARVKKLYGILEFSASPQAGLLIMVTIPN